MKFSELPDDFEQPKPVFGIQIWKWPEFRAFADRLGIPAELRTTDLVIKIPHDSLVEVTQVYQGVGGGALGSGMEMCSNPAKPGLPEPGAPYTGFGDYRPVTPPFGAVEGPEPKEYRGGADR